MLGQMTLALPFLSGGLAGNRDVWITTGVLWLVVAGMTIATRLSAQRNVGVPGTNRVRDWLERFPLRSLRPFFVGFIALTVFDVLIQGLASRAFGVPIDWIALAARIPLLYLALVVPTLGNFGTREVAWAGLFAEFGDKDTLFAYALAVNAVFLVLNLMIGIVFLAHALRLVSAVRKARDEGEEVKDRLLHDPTDL